MELLVPDENATQDLGVKLGRFLKGGEVIELIGDVGAGKTTFTRAIARGMGITGAIQSPTFTINNLYDAPNGLRLSHYDFYRLNDGGVMADELAETTSDVKTVTVVEWADIVAGVLPEDRITVSFVSLGEIERQLNMTASGERSKKILEDIS